MAQHAFTYSDTLASTNCVACGTVFALPEDMLTDLRRTHRTFYCPNGHTLSFSGPSEADKLKAELAREKQRREMAEREAQMESKRATKAARKLERIEKRVHHGVCPCCNRSFQNLRRHMETKHPERKATE